MQQCEGQKGAVAAGQNRVDSCGRCWARTRKNRYVDLSTIYSAITERLLRDTRDKPRMALGFEINPLPVDCGLPQHY
ncbi:hypothetical protein RRG08_018905 [Elysia crispata]|uniref:Uncharacterized protein n=1 Tax=Elysia crispata TaxID=231223 RepID=A0AAE1DVH7_9GAST|nr:hypothetical protein RRG08_018905 [Elysia crispata]